MVLGLFLMLFGAIPAHQGLSELFNWLDTSDFYKAREFEHEAKDWFNATVYDIGEEKWDSCYGLVTKQCEVQQEVDDCRPDVNMSATSTEAPVRRSEITCRVDYRPYLKVMFRDKGHDKVFKRCAYKNGISSLSDTDTWYHPWFKALSNPIAASHDTLRSIKEGHRVEIWTLAHPSRCIIGFGSFKRYLNDEEGRFFGPILLPLIVGISCCCAGIMICAKLEPLMDVISSALPCEDSDGSSEEWLTVGEEASISVP